MNERIQHNCVHISLNFDPTEHFSRDKCTAIAVSYLQKLGFGDQPYLVYQHTDAAHDHLHIVTTPIKADGTPLRLHHLASRASEPARKAVEKEFSLIRAESKKQPELFVLKPIDLDKAVYGKMPTKAAIATIVRSVAAHYKFTSLPEYNAALQQFNVLADRGAVGTRMFEKKGLQYFLLDPANNKVGIPIKASAIYGSPTLKNLENRFVKNDQDRRAYKEPLCRNIDTALARKVDMEGFETQLRQQGIRVQFRRNSEQAIYGITYVDNGTCCVFNGSDLGKSYAAKSVVSQLQARGFEVEAAENRMETLAALATTDFTKGLNAVLTQWAMKGLVVSASTEETGTLTYSMGRYTGSPQPCWPLSYKMNAYLSINGFSMQRAAYLQKRLQEIARTQPTLLDTFQAFTAMKSECYFRGIIDECFRVVEGNDYLSGELLKEAKRKNRRRRSP